MLSVVWQWLKSRKLAYWLIVLFTGEIVMGALLPQEQFAITGSNLMLTEFPQLFLFLKQVGLLPIFSSWLFLGTMLLFFLNTLCCTIEQTIKAFQRLGGREGIPVKCKCSFEGLDEQKITIVLKRHGFRVKHRGELIFAQRGIVGCWATVLFHLSLLLIISGSILTQAFKFEGSFYLAEGQTWSNKVENYLGYQKGPWFKPWMYPDFQLTLEKFTASYPLGEFPQQLSSQVVLLEQGNVIKKQTVQVVKPLRYKGFTIYQIKHGYAPEISLQNSEGQVLLDAVVSLSTNAQTEEYKDEITIPGIGLRVGLRFLPNFRQDSPTRYSSKSFEPKNPGLVVTVSDSENKIVFQGPLMVGKEINFQGYSLRFADYRQWSGFTAVLDPGFPVIFAGFILGTFGLVSMFFSRINTNHRE